MILPISCSPSTEESFKEDLMALERECAELRAGAGEHKQVVRARDKLVKENQELRTIIASQDEQVPLLCTVYVCLCSYMYTMKSSRTVHSESDFPH